MAELDIFISLSSHDQKQVALIVEALRLRNLNVCWMGDFEEGRWDFEIEEQLRKAKRVLAIVTPQVDQSIYDFIFLELKYAREHNKLIPLIVGEGSSVFSIRGIIGRLQSYFFEDLDTLLETPEFEKLVRVCGGEPREALFIEASRPPATPLDRIEAWYTKIEKKYARTERVTIFSMATAAAVFEHSSPGRVRQLAKHLENLIEDPPLSSETLEGPTAPERLTPLLKEISCRLTTSTQTNANGETGVAFEDHERATAMLEFAWMEFGDRRDALSIWMSNIVGTGTGDEVMSISFALGLLAQQHFDDVFERLLVGWIFGRNTRQRYAADIALSVAAFEPRIAAKIRDILEDWSSQGSAERAKAAVRLASGYTAMRLPDVAIKTFRKVTEQQQVSVRADVFGEMRSSLASFLRLSAVEEDNSEVESKEPSADTTEAANAEKSEKPQDATAEVALESFEDNSLFDLPGLIVKLADWALEDPSAPHSSSTQGVSTPYPLALVLFVLDEIRLVSPTQRPYMLSWSRLIEQPTTADATVAIFSRALERHRFGELESRRLAQDVLRKRIKRVTSLKRRHSNIANDTRYETLLNLARLLFAKATTKNDKDRIVYLFKPLFNSDVLCS